MMHDSVSMWRCFSFTKPVNHIRVLLDHWTYLYWQTSLHSMAPSPRLRLGIQGSATRHQPGYQPTPARGARGTCLTVRVPAEAVVVVAGLAAPHAAPAQHARPQAPLGRLGGAQVRGQQQTHHQPPHTALHLHQCTAVSSVFTITERTPYY